MGSVRTEWNQKGINKPKTTKVETSESTRHFQSSHLGYSARTPDIYVCAVYIDINIHVCI